MLFNSFTYLLLFLPVAALGNAFLHRYLGAPWSQGWLLAISLLFYACAKPEHLVFLGVSIIFNWGIARLLAAQTGEGVRKALLSTGLIVNLAFLCCFKYINFFLGLTASFGPRVSLPDWEFPLGISFFTLTQVMYLVDTYQGLNGANSLFDHATFVSLFPYVSSGPLVRSRLLVPQFRTYSFNETRLSLACRGLYLFAWGLAKKVVLADSFASVADAGFSSLRPLSTVEAWVFSLAFTFQLYFDFSGYSDMAVGSAWMLGIDIPQNFNAPFRSRSISEFWQRWHISLSNFITNYLYTPLIRSMGKATVRTSAVAILLAMGIAGLWHGPAWTFVVFGLLHGAGLAINQLWKKRKLPMPNLAGMLLTFLFVNLTFVFFRSPNINFAVHFVSRMLPHENLFGLGALQGVIPLSPTLVLRPLIIGAVCAFAFKTSAEMAKAFATQTRTTWTAALLIVTALFFMNSTPAKQFVYFAF